MSAITGRVVLTSVFDFADCPGSNEHRYSSARCAVLCCMVCCTTRTVQNADLLGRIVSTPWKRGGHTNTTQFAQTHTYIRAHSHYKSCISLHTRIVMLAGSFLMVCCVRCFIVVKWPTCTQTNNKHLRTQCCVRAILWFGCSFCPQHNRRHTVQRQGLVVSLLFIVLPSFHF